MGLFRDVGRQVERFKRSATAVADETAAYRCADCDAGFHTDHERCPECGGEAVTTVQSTD